MGSNGKMPIYTLTIRVRIDPATYNILHREAVKTGDSKSKIVRDLIRKELTK